MIDVVQAPWLSEGEAYSIPIKAFGAKILCDRHNTALSNLDNLAKKFFAFLIQAEPKKDILFVNGHEIERWMLKLLCGVYASSESNNWIPGEQWLKILFDNWSISEPCGLHFISENHSAFIRQRGIGVRKSSNTDLPVEVTFVIQGFRLVLSMEKFTPLKQENAFKAYYRPMGIQIEEANGLERIVHLGWPNGEIVFIGRGEPYNIK